MADLRRDWPESRRRCAAARGTDVARTPAGVYQAGVSNHLLARALSTGNPPAGAALQRVFQFNGKQVPRDAKVPRIHGVKAADLQKLAEDDAHDYGAITDAGSVAAAMQVYEARHRVVVALAPLDETYAGYRTVWNDDAFAEHNEQTVRATFQLDSMQGEHDSAFAADKDARKKAGGQQMPPQSDYATLAQGVPADRRENAWTRSSAGQRGWRSTSRCSARSRMTGTTMRYRPGGRPWMKGCISWCTTTAIRPISP